MKIEFNRELSRVRDAIEGLTLSYKDNYKTIYEEYNLNLNKAAEEALHSISESVTVDIPCSEMLFSKETSTALAFVNSRFIPPDLTIDSFADYLSGLSEEETRRIVLADLNFMGGANLSYEEVCRIAQDEVLVLDFLRKLDLSSAVKWETLEFLGDVKNSMEGFIKLVTRYIPVYRKIYKKNKKMIEEFENYAANGIESEGEAFITKLLRGSISYDAEQVIVGTVFFNSRSLINATVGKKLYVYIGMDFEETIRLTTGEGDMDYMISVYKNLSDKTRFLILNLLKEKELYGQEIAERVGITMATVSYHMSYLLASNLVKLEKVGQKGYYSLKRDTLRKSMEFLNNFFNL